MNKLHKHLIKNAACKMRKALARISNGRKEYRFDKRNPWHDSIEDYEICVAESKAVFTENNIRFFAYQGFLIGTNDGRLALMFRSIYLRDIWEIYPQCVYGNNYTEKCTYEEYHKLFKSKQNG